MLVPSSSSLRYSGQDALALACYCSNSDISYRLPATISGGEHCSFSTSYPVAHWRSLPPSSPPSNQPSASTSLRACPWATLQPVPGLCGGIVIRESASPTSDDRTLGQLIECCKTHSEGQPWLYKQVIMDISRSPRLGCRCHGCCHSCLSQKTRLK